jgi:DNA-directed RNA polymerase subunit alpha
LLDFVNPHSTYESVGENRGRFMVEPLARGFGYTFGNSLRRVLLSSLEGAAISAVKITGVEHEFSTVPHVKEDVTDIILNLKKIVFVLHGEVDEHEVYLDKDEPGTITAGDIRLPATAEVMDPSAYIATLEEGGRLEMQLTVRRGRGYAPADDNKPPETIVGVIPIDSIFSPVIRVAYSVEPARVGQRTDYDKLTLEIETNGALDPRAAVVKAAAMLRDDLEQIFLGDTGEEEDEFSPKPGTGQAKAQPDRPPEYDMVIEELELGVRSLNCLKREDIQTIGDLISRSEQDLMNIPNFGRKSLDEVREQLEKKYNLRLKGE